MYETRDDATAGPRLLALLAGLLLFGACSDDPVDPDPGCGESAPLPLGVTTDSVLSIGDPVLDGSLINYFAVAPDQAGTLVVEMAAEIPADPDRPGLDPFLYLWTDNLGDPIAQGYDQTGEGPLLRVARLTAAVGPGCYRVGASGWPGRAQGAYTLRADLAPSF